MILSDGMARGYIGLMLLTRKGTSCSLPEHLKDMEEKGLLKRGEKPLPADFWGLPRPADPQGAVLSALLREREEGR